MTTPSKLEVNAAIETLIGGDEASWYSAARTVLSYGLRLPVSGGTVTESIKSESHRNRETTSAYAAGVGDVPIEEADREKRRTEVIDNSPVERVGAFKIIHLVHEDCDPQLIIWDFGESLAWKNPLDYQLGTRYCLLYTPDGQPLLFGENVHELEPIPLAAQLCDLAWTWIQILLIRVGLRRALNVTVKRIWTRTAITVHNSILLNQRGQTVALKPKLAPKK